jgi:putative flippase GtrA
MHSRNKGMLASFTDLTRHPIVRWLGVGLLFYLIGLALLHTMVEVLKLPLTASTLLTQEATTIVRYVINDRWVFHEKRLSWTRLWQFHVANAGGFTAGWIVTIILPRFGVHYLVASTVGTAVSMLLTMTTNFLWIWRKRTKALPRDVETTPAVVGMAEPDECLAGSGSTSSGGI